MKTMDKKKLSLLYAFLVYTIFGFSFLFSKVALAVSTPSVLLAVRFSLAFLILNLILLTGKVKLQLKGKNIKALLILGILSPIIYFICENYGVKLLATSLVGIILSTIPVASAIFGFLFLGEKISPIQVVCVVASAFGVCLTTFGQQAGAFSWLGFILILAAACVTSLATVLSRKISAEFTAFERTYVSFALGSTAFVLIALIQCRGNMREMLLVPLANLNFWISIIFLAILSSVCAYFMLNYAMGHLDVAKAAIFANVSTVISILAGVFFLNESFGLYQILGSVVIITSVCVMNWPKG